MIARRIGLLGTCVILVCCDAAGPATPAQAAEQTVELDPLPLVRSCSPDAVAEHVVARRFGDRDAVLVIAADETHRHVVLFEADPAGDDPAGYRRALATRFERPNRQWMYPGPPSLGDLDGDGVDEILLTFHCGFADRTSTTAMVFSRQSGTWRALKHPSVLGELRRSGHRASGFCQDDKLEFADIDGTTLALRGVYAGGDWQILTRPSGGAGLLGIASIGRRGQEYVFAMFRLSSDGFEPDLTWNGGAIHRVPGPLRDYDVGELCGSLFQ